MSALIERSDDLEWLKTWREKQIIKVVSGVRRCGKSTLFEIYRKWLAGQGVEGRQIISINFEDLEYEHLTDYRLLYDYIHKRLIPGKMNYIFLDEIQHVERYEKAVDSLFLKNNCDIYMTGSNAYFMSGELATVLSGRYVELKMLPLSFREFCSAMEDAQLTNAQKFNRYIENGSFPYIAKFGIESKEAKDYLRDIYHSVLLKDIVARYKISDITALENVTKFLLHNIGSRVSPAKIAGMLKADGKGTDQKTVDKYIRGLRDSLMIYEAQRYQLKGRQLLKTNGKYYAVDIGLRNSLVKGSESDIGHVLENIVFLELKRRGYDVYIGQLDENEIDFVAVDGDSVSYYQVSATTLDENTLRRELAPFDKLRDHYPKYLLTLDDVFGKIDYNGVKKINVLDWLLER